MRPTRKATLTKEKRAPPKRRVDVRNYEGKSLGVRVGFNATSGTLRAGAGDRPPGIRS